MHLDLNAKKYETAADLVAMLNQYLEKWEAVYGDEKKTAVLKNVLAMSLSKPA